MPMQIDLGGETRILKYTWPAMRALEHEAGMGIGKITSADQQGYNTMCLLVWAGLRHENKRLTPDQVAEWLQKYIETGGTFQALGILVKQALMEGGVVAKEPEGEA